MGGFGGTLTAQCVVRTDRRRKHHIRTIFEMVCKMERAYLARIHIENRRLKSVDTTDRRGQPAGSVDESNTPAYQYQATVAAATATSPVTTSNGL